MIESDKISVIIPVYKVEKYLDKCIQSVVDQTYKNLEIILVDDGLPDRCGEICDAWAKKDGRIKVIHKANGGISDARNVGLDIATGEYIGFVDSDDYIHPEMYHKLYDKIRENDAELAMCGYYRISELDDKIICSDNSCGDGLLDKEQALKQLWQHGTFMSIWNKLYKRDLFINQRFAYGKISEDIFILPYIYMNCTKIIAIAKEYYYYVQTINSICRSEVTVKKMDGVEAYYNMLIFYRDHGFSELLEDISFKMIDLYIWNRERIRQILPNERKRIREIKKMVRYGYIHYGGKIKLIHKIYVESPAIYHILLKFRNVIK